MYMKNNKAFLADIDSKMAEFEQQVQRSENKILEETQRLTFGGPLITDELLASLSKGDLLKVLPEEEVNRIKKEDATPEPASKQVKTRIKKVKKKTEPLPQPVPVVKNSKPKETVDDIKKRVTHEVDEHHKVTEPVKKRQSKVDEPNYTMWTITGMCLLLCVIIGYFVFF